ncbi:hypothetical protein TL16_g00885 [Triparma laevis f. inornata]|uniref:Vacuolar sorting receptor thioredoxin-like domain-containing protein n=1 Tax=Triparma laevis f. inornata TaxID=1714386 RepID=A0A9W7DQE8_9STRA|nr:hypothetical protein TL16_g00885 [Triparma laevis f. inornata]
MTTAEIAAAGGGDFILMVERGLHSFFLGGEGTCTFMQKAYNAEIGGAKALIITDNACLCDDEIHGGCHSEEQCENVSPIMGNDGVTGGVEITSVLIKKQDGERAREYFGSDHCSHFTCVAKLTFSIAAPDDRVEWDLWEGSSWYPERGGSPLVNFLPYVKALGDSAYFTPEYLIFEGLPPNADCHSGGFGACSTLCTNHGRYCAYDPDGLAVGFTGADVVAEALRRLCIWKHYSVGEQTGIGEKWWEYSLEFLEQCDSRFNYPSIYDWTCSSNVMLEVGIDKAVIEECMEESGGTMDATENLLLQQQVDAIKEAGISHELVHEVTVNLVSVSGAVDPVKTFKSICRGFLDGTWPEVCLKCEGCEGYVEECVGSEGFVCGPGGEGGGGDEGGEGEDEEDGGFIPDFDVPGLPDFSHCTEGGDETPGTCSTTQTWAALQAIQKFQDCSGWQLAELLPVMMSSIAGLQEVAAECGAGGDEEDDGDRLLRSLRNARNTLNGGSGSGRKLPTGEDICEGRNFNENQCNVIGCCEWEGGKCWSAVGTGKCEGGPRVDEECEAAATEFLMNSEITPYFLDVVNHPMHYCSCSSEFGDSLPACLITLPGQDPVDLSLLKTITCVMSDDCDWLEESCGPVMDFFNECFDEMDCGKKCLLPIDEAGEAGQNAFWCLEDENEHVDETIMAELNFKIDAYRAACGAGGGGGDGGSKATGAIIGVLVISVVGFMVYKKVLKGGRRNVGGFRGVEGGAGGGQGVTMNALRGGGTKYEGLSKEEEGGGAIVQASAASFEI